MKAKGGEVSDKESVVNEQAIISCQVTINVHAHSYTYAQGHGHAGMHAHTNTLKTGWRPYTFAQSYTSAFRPHYAQNID